MEFKRFLDLKPVSQKKSLFLFGPRQTGKTFLLRKKFPQSPFYNLLLADVFLKVSQRPQIIREELLAKNHSIKYPIIIDEVQKLPLLLDEVQALIDEKKWHFILTGSSARKMKRGGANLLGGRARTYHLYPLTSAEIPHYDLIRILNYGTLPSIYNSDQPEAELADYVGNYLKEEIQAEGLARKVENFSRFLQTASLSNAELVNFTSIGSDAQVPPRTVTEYFTILQDTLIGYLLEPFTKTKKRKAISTAKFYFFDVGVANFLAGRKQILPRTELFGKALEHFVFTELKAYLDYTRDPRPLTFWRAAAGQEVDFLIGESIAIEVKATERVTEKHLQGLKAMAEEKMDWEKKIVVSTDKEARRIGSIDILPVEEFLKRLWGGGFSE